MIVLTYLFLLISGDFALLYKCHFNLAKQFTAPHEKRLSDHFYKICLEDTEQHECDSDGRARAESNLYVGLAAETEGNVFTCFSHCCFDCNKFETKK